MLIVGWRSEWEQNNAQYDIYISEYACKKRSFLKIVHIAPLPPPFGSEEQCKTDVNTCKTRLVWSEGGNTQTFLLEQVFLFITKTHFFLRNT